MSRESNHGYVDSGLLERCQVRFANTAVGDQMVDGRGRCNRTQGAAAELAGVANHNHDPGHIHHGTVDFGLELVGRGQAMVHVEAIHTKKKNVGVQSPQGVVRNRPDKRE